MLSQDSCFPRPISVTSANKSMSFLFSKNKQYAAGAVSCTLCECFVRWVFTQAGRGAAVLGVLLLQENSPAFLTSCLPGLRGSL